MRGVRLMCAFGVVAGVFTASHSSASAQDATVLVAGTETGGGPSPERFLLFSGIDLWRASTAAYGGLHWAPNGLNQDGVIARLLLSRNLERYDADSTTIVRASALAGLRVRRGEFELKLMAGPHFVSFEPTAPAAQQSGARLGFQAVIETWWEPTAALMLASSWSAATLDSGYGGRVAAGWRLFDRFWSGPELAVSTDAFSTQYRFGLHLTGYRWQDLEWSAAIGYLQDSFSRDGAYARIGVLLRR